MMQIFLVILTAVVALSAGQRICQKLEGMAGQSITLKTNADIKQSDDLYIVWSFGPENQVKVEFKNGKLTKGDPNTFQLDLKTGALTIKFLSANDSGLYEGQIFEGGNVKSLCFQLAVVEAEQSHHENLRAHQRNHTAAFGVLGLACIVLLAVWIKRKCQSKSPSPQNFCMVTTEDPPTVV